jgi:uncharacterized protein with HEPN domain
VDGLSADVKTLDAVLYNLQVIGDVVTNKVPQLCQQVEQILSQD